MEEFPLQQKKRNLNQKNPIQESKQSGTCNGFVTEDFAFNSIQNSGANILFVGLGCPKQEEFILKYKDKLKNIKLFMPVGGSFDVISKSLKRAPNWIIKLNLEWLYRVLKQPKRIFRQLNSIKFIFLVLTKKILEVI